MAGGALLPAAPQPREVDRSCCSRVASPLGFVLLGVGSGSTGISDVLQNAFNFGERQRHVDLEAAEEGREAPEQRAGAGATSRPRYEQKQRTQDAVDRARALHGAAPEGPERARRSSRRSTRRSPTIYATDYSNAQTQATAQRLARRRRSQPPSTTPFGKAFADPNGAAGPDRGRRRSRCVDRAEHAPTRTTRRRSRSAEYDLPEARRAHAERRDDPDPARPGGAGSRRHARPRSPRTRSS